mgnify:FL=1
MKITILNANIESNRFADYLDKVRETLEQNGHQVTNLLLRDLPLKYCTGCWGCWVKTPGMCRTDEASQEMDKIIINSDFILWAAPLKMGYPSTLLKMAMDKHLPLIHPYMEVDQQEGHHLKRYAVYPRLGLVLEKEPSTDEKDLQMVTQMCQRTALNFKSRLYFSETSATPAVDLAARITDVSASPLALPVSPAPTQGVAIPAPASLTLFNGSPRGPHGNSPIFLEQLAKGFGGPTKMVHLVNVNSTAEHVQSFAEADAAWIAFPLYTDAMPAIVKHFIEALEPLTSRGKNPPLGFIVQSGFPEGLHSRYVEQYLEKLAARLGSPYLGTIVKGNGEGVRIMTPQMTRSLFENLHALGKNLAQSEKLDSAVLAKIARPERFPAIFGPLFKLFLRTPLAHTYFDSMLKENGVYDKRFNQPFI